MEIETKMRSKWNVLNISGFLWFWKPGLQLRRLLFCRMHRVCRRKQGALVNMVNGKFKHFVLILCQIQLHVTNLEECIFQCDFFHSFQGTAEAMYMYQKKSYYVQGTWVLSDMFSVCSSLIAHFSSLAHHHARSFCRSKKLINIKMKISSPMLGR